MEVNSKIAGLTDINMRELLTLMPLVILVFWIGVYPNVFLDFMHASVEHLLEQVNAAHVAAR
ncbi:hypothetical protein ACFLZI_04010 [Nitrospirota bacterium]